jgi:hypothetical protein
MFKFFCFLLLAAGWVLAASAIHVVRTPANFLTVNFVTKNALTFDDTYVDARPWTARDLPAHRDLVRRLVTAGKADTLAHLVDPKSGDLAPQLIDLAGKPKPVAQSNDPAADKSIVDAALAQYHAAKKNVSDASRVLAGAH